jgi:hypothetical protein
MPHCSQARTGTPPIVIRRQIVRTRGGAGRREGVVQEGFGADPAPSGTPRGGDQQRHGHRNTGRAERNSRSRAKQHPLCTTLIGANFHKAALCRRAMRWPTVPPVQRLGIAAENLAGMRVDSQVLKGLEVVSKRKCFTHDKF